MYEKCAYCEKIGISCRGPKFVSMSPEDLLELCRLRKKHLGISNQQIAERASMPKGTVDNLFAATHADFRYGTIQPVLDVLFGGEVSGNSCPGVPEEERTEYEEKLRLANEQVVQLQAVVSKIETDYEKKIVFLKEQVKFKEDQMKEKDDLLKERGTIIAQRGDFMKRKDRVIVTLAILLAICLLIIIGALVVDRMNGGVGFFWLESLLKPQGITEILLKWRT